MDNDNLALRIDLLNAWLACKLYSSEATKILSLLYNARLRYKTNVQGINA